MKTKRGPWNTARFKNRTLIYHDKARSRYVISRRANGLTRKTSRRYGFGMSHLIVSEFIAYYKAREVASRLKACPAHKLSTFKF